MREISYKKPPTVVMSGARKVHADPENEIGICRCLNGVCPTDAAQALPVCVVMILAVIIAKLSDRDRSASVYLRIYRRSARAFYHWGDAG